MFGVIVCTHSNLAAGLRDAVEMIMQKQEAFQVVGFQEGDNLEELSKELGALVRKNQDAGLRTIVAVDLFGATPFNASAIALAEEDAQVLTGVNLPMLLELFSRREDSDGSDLEEIAEEIAQMGKAGIKAVKMREMFHK